MFNDYMKYFASINKLKLNDKILKGYSFGGFVLAYKQKHAIIEVHFPHPNKRANYLSGLISISG